MTVSIQASQLPAELQKLAQQANGPDASAQLASKFQSLMEKPSMASPAQPSIRRCHSARWAGSKARCRASG